MRCYGLLGVMRYNQQTEIVEFCDGMKWTIVHYLEIGETKTRNASSCREIAERYNSSQWNGPYWIKPSEGEPAFKVSGLEYNVWTKFRCTNKFLLHCLFRLIAMLRKAGL